MRAEDLVAVVVCTRDRPAMLRDLLATLPVALRPGDELVVVDSASRDPRVAKVLEAAAGSGLPLRVVRCERPGASRARNAGVAATTAPVIAFVDDDCRPTAGWTAAIAGAFARHPEIGFAYGSVIADDAPGIAVAVLPDAPLHADLGNIIGLGHGANLAVRSTAFQSVGGFDEALGPGAPLRAAEDKDLQARLLRSGWE
ncbi:MAG TPA: glycosyltransferase family A protein, partial [Mycobacteriales bacterium]|nr:glycosyltransferase family A protein [Mycobacteriales bacterium]